MTSDQLHLLIWKIVANVFHDLPTGTGVRFWAALRPDGYSIREGLYIKTMSGRFQHTDGDRIFAPDLPDSPRNNSFVAEEIANVIAVEPERYSYAVVTIL